MRSEQKQGLAARPDCLTQPVQDGRALNELDGVGGILPRTHELLPQVHEVYELRLASIEANILSDEEAIRRAAYFASVTERKTHHYCMCTGEPLGVSPASARRRAFFAANIFRTGYATHGFFPYRGKFHPQMVKGLINAMGIPTGGLILDPMMGSGTTLVEGATMGIRAAGIDASPFCVLMSRAKADALATPTEGLRSLQRHASGLERVSGALRESLRWDCGKNDVVVPDLGTGADAVVALAFLDSLGFSMRSDRLSQQDAFQEILGKYVGAMDKFQQAASSLGIRVAPVKCFRGDARSTGLPPDVADGILFSPPYSFAVDYIENDLAQLELLGVQSSAVRGTMVGLRGRPGAEQLDLYRSDVRAIMAECQRVMKPGTLCAVVVGTNSRQLEALAKKARLRDVESSLEEMWVDAAGIAGLEFEYQIGRQIVGIANTMREEAILFFRKPHGARVEE